MFNTIWMVFGIFFSIVSFFPLINSTHWVFRLFDFVRLQISVILILLLLVIPILSVNNSIIFITVAFISIALIYQLFVILPYFPKKQNIREVPENSIVALSVNVKQNNKDYHKLIKLVKQIDPDILLTLETNKEWEKNLEELESELRKVVSVPKENRYGIHFYTKLDVKEFKIHYLISEEHPSIEVTLTDYINNEFIFWGIHPPPPSPTEKPTSKQKDAELMKVAKIVRNSSKPIIVSGDFNNVAWSKASKLFSKISNLKDARINRGIYSTFPANFPILGFPIDLLFHTESLTISDIKVLSSIGSDHLPLQFIFHSNSNLDSNIKLDSDLESIANKKIKEGKEAAKNEN